MIQPLILEKLEKLPESFQKEVLHYIEFLTDKYEKSSLKVEVKVQEEQTKKNHGYGSWTGQIIMSDDFDEPLADLEEYM